MNSFKDRMITSTTAIAVIAIVWNILQSTDNLGYWWSLPLLAGLTGIFAILISALGKKCFAFHSITGAGLALLVIPITQKLFFHNFFAVWEAILLFAVITELTQKTAHLGSFLLDLVICFASAFLITKYDSTIITVIILLITYLLVILIDFDFQFSFKGANKENENDLPTDEYVDVE